MHVCRLRIFGFRGVESADVPLLPKTVLIGPNGCGKTTIGDALSLVLGRPRMVRALTEHDFFGSSPAPQTRVRIVATISGFPSNDPGEHPHWFQMGRAVPKWLGPDGKEHGQGAEGRRLCANIGFAARFDPDDLDVVTTRYFHDDDDVEDPFASTSQSVSAERTRVLRPPISPRLGGGGVVQLRPFPEDGRPRCGDPC
jgi:predicted ATP-dependent endonuclease of OLD family